MTPQPTPSAKELKERLKEEMDEADLSEPSITWVPIEKTTLREIISALDRAGTTEKEGEGLAVLRELREFARERNQFGIQVEVQNRADPESRFKGNKTGEAYGGGYEECARHFENEIDRRIAEIEASQKAREDEGVKGLTDNREPDSAKSMKDKEEPMP